MARVRWTDTAQEQFQKILEEWKQLSAKGAARIRRQILSATRRLGRLPRIGRVVPELGVDDCRELFVRPFRVIYLIRREACYVSRIYHGSRDLAALLSRDQLFGEIEEE